MTHYVCTWFCRYACSDCLKKVERIEEADALREQLQAQFSHVESLHQPAVQPGVCMCVCVCVCVRACVFTHSLISKVWLLQGSHFALLTEPAVSPKRLAPSRLHRGSNKPASATGSSETNDDEWTKTVEAAQR